MIPAVVIAASAGAIIWWQHSCLRDLKADRDFWRSEALECHRALQELSEGAS
jgi:hypothetical protein